MGSTVEPGGQLATHVPALHKFDAHASGIVQGWPMMPLHAPPDGTVLSGQSQEFAVAFQVEPLGEPQVHDVDPRPVLVEPVPHATHVGRPVAE